MDFSSRAMKVFCWTAFAAMAILIVADIFAPTIREAIASRKQREEDVQRLNKLVSGLELTAKQTQANFPIQDPVTHSRQQRAVEDKLAGLVAEGYKWSLKAYELQKQEETLRAQNQTSNAGNEALAGLEFQILAAEKEREKIEDQWGEIQNLAARCGFDLGEAHNFHKALSNYEHRLEQQNQKPPHKKIGAAFLYFYP